MPTRILIADDHALLRAGLISMLNSEPDLEIIGEASTAEEAVRLAVELTPDLVLMDLSMPEMGGIEATRIVVERLPAIRVLILTMHEDQVLAREAIHVGASGYILKRAVLTELISAIHTVLQGDLYVHPQIVRNLLAEPKPAPVPTGLGSEPLTSREIEVLHLLARGYTNNQIAKQLSLSVRTVEYHRSNIMGKLNLSSRVDLLRYAAEHGIT